MSNFAEATVTPLPSDGGGMPMEARRDNEESFGGDDVDGEGLSVSTTLTKAEALQAKGMMGWEEDDISFLPVPKLSDINFSLVTSTVAGVLSIRPCQLLQC